MISIYPDEEQQSSRSRARMSVTCTLVRSQIDSLYPDSKNDDGPASHRRESCPTSPATRRLWSIFSSLEKSSGSDTGSPVRGRIRVRFRVAGHSRRSSIHRVHTQHLHATHVYTHTHTHISVPFTVCNEYIYIYVYMYMYLYVYIYIMHVHTYEENDIHPQHAHQKILTSRRVASHEQSVPVPL